MLLEISCVIGIIAFVTLLIKERDFSYVIGFMLGFLMGLWIEPPGIANSFWKYQNIVEPFNYTIFGTPICIYLLYASIAAAVVFLNKCFIELRKKYKERLDKTVGYACVIAGVAFLILSFQLGTSPRIGLAFVMTGLYMFVKDPVIFYVGATALASDFVFENFIFNKQLIYSTSYGNVGVAFFLGGAILSAIFILIKKHLPKLRNVKK
jgi:hypothetical protein